MDKISSLRKLSEALQQEDPKPPTDLNEDMDRMFESQDDNEDFSISKLSTPSASAPWSPGYAEETRVQEAADPRIRDTDVQLHHSDSFPHVHHPLKPHHHRVRRRSHKSSTNDDAPPPYSRLESPDEKDGKKGEKSDVNFDVGDPDLDDGWSTGMPKKKESLIGSPKKSPRVEDSEDDEERYPLLGDDSKLKPCIKPAEKAAEEPEVIPYIDDSARKKSRVQFDIGEDEEQPALESKEKTRRRRSHRKKSRDPVEDPTWRRRAGSERELLSHSAPTTEEEAQYLEEHDLDDMSSHRFDDPSGYQRSKVRARSSVSSIIHMSDKDKKKDARQMPIMKKTYDHSPHEVFVELDELKYTEGGLEWKETARWIKYEEDVEGVANRWGRPHIAFLNFHALFSLRKGLDGGAVLLDLEEKDLPSIAARVVDKMVACDQIPPDQRDAVIRVLLLRHRHIKESQSSFRLPSRGSKSTLASSEEKLTRSPTTQSLDGLRSSVRKAGLSNLFHVNTFSAFRRGSTTNEDSTNGVISNGNVLSDPKADKKEHQESYTQIDIEGDVTPKDKGSRDDLRKSKDILKKIPEGAEATAVLVGAVDFLKQPTIAFVRLAEGVMMDNLVEVPIPVRFMFVLLGPFHGEMDYHEVGRSISTLMSDKGFHEVAYRAHSRGQLLSAINEFLNASIVLPPSDWNNTDLVPVDDIRAKAHEINKKKESMRSKQRHVDAAMAQVSAGDGDDGDKKPPPRDPLIRTGTPFYGFVQDAKFRFPQYLSDFRDGLSGQVLAAAIFIFFAALSAAITFGGMYGDLMENYIGVGETLLISAVNGILFALFAVQPLLIVGATGPLMIFDVSLYTFCQMNDIDFLSIRVWIGVWMTVTALLIAAFEAVAIVKKFTRFTEEIFSTLVCLIFIYESFVKLAGIFKEHPLQAQYGYEDVNHTEIVSGIIVNGTLFNGTNANGTEVEFDDVLPAQPNTSLLSMILMLLTFIIAYKLKHFRNSKFLGRSIRRALGDFGVPISIVLMVSLDYLVHDTYTDKLTMPEGLQPSNTEVRGWLINPFGVTKALPVWCIFAAAPASLLLFCLIFLEENICHLILSKPEKNMVKGSGFHWDIVMSAAINIVSGIFGAPFMGPACVRTVSHTSALTVMSSTHAPGESPKIVGVLEQRVSAFVVSVLIGLSVFLTAALNLVPKAVLFGIFLYMGVSATAGIQFLERLMLVFMPVKHHPNVAYVKKVRTWKMHAFTGIQLFLLAVLWIVKQSPAALCFPFVLMLLIPIRLFLLPYVFNSTELSSLDGKEAAAKVDDDDEPDFFEETHGLPAHLDHVHQS